MDGDANDKQQRHRLFDKVTLWTERYKSENFGESKDLRSELVYKCLADRLMGKEVEIIESHGNLVVHHHHHHGVESCCTVTVDHRCLATFFQSTPIY